MYVSRDADPELPFNKDCHEKSRNFVFNWTFWALKCELYLFSLLVTVPYVCFRSGSLSLGIGEKVEDPDPCFDGR
jgi:hypothetical protein